MMFVVMVTTSRGQAPEPLGPFPDLRWARRYVERIKKYGYFLVEIKHLTSPRLLGIKKGTDDIEVVFDPKENIDK